MRDPWAARAGGLIKAANFGVEQSTHKLSALALLLGALVLCSAADGETRAKTDAITLRNGDRITGRIISAQYGFLQLDSQHSGSVSIEWPSVRTIETRYQFRVVRFGGQHYAGPIRTSADGENLIVGSGPTAVSIPMSQVASLVPFEESFWRRVDGDVSAGYAFTKASDITQGNLGFSANYNGTNVQASLQTSAILSRDSSGATTEQEQVQANAFFLRPSPNFWGLLGTLQRDRSLGVDARFVAGAALGRRLIETYKSSVTGIVGVVHNEERGSEGAGTHSSLEGVLGGEWRIYKFTYPKIRLDSSLLLYPSITESPRLRGTLNITLTYKLTERFALKATQYGNYDSRPPSPGAATTDYGITASLSYSFGPVIQ